MGSTDLGSLSSLGSVGAHLLPGAPAAPDGIIGPSLKHLALLIVSSFFHSLVTWVVDGDQVELKRLWAAMSVTSNPVVSGNWFSSDFSTMATIGAAVVVPLLCVGAIQAVARQDASSLLRTACMKLPFAILFAAVAVEIVQLGLAATDQASAALLASGGNRLHELLQQQLSAVTGIEDGFVQFLMALIECVVCFFVWFELAVRSAAVAVATLFLPLALAGLAWPATSHWARRLGETLAGLILLKLVIAAVLALAVGAVNERSAGLSGVMEGIALLALAAAAPFAIFRLIPMIEAGAVTHFDGLGHRPPAFAAAQGSRWVTDRFGSHGGKSGASGASLGGAGGDWRPPDRHAGGPVPGGAATEARSGDGGTGRSSGLGAFASTSFEPPSRGSGPPSGTDPFAADAVD